MPYEIDIVQIPKDVSAGRLAEAVIDIETGSAAFICGIDRDFAVKLVEFMNRFERINGKK